MSLPLARRTPTTVVTSSYCRQASKLSTSLTYCQDLVKKRDYEHYLSTLLVPKDARAGAFAVRAFNISIASVRENSSDSNISRMRLMFWKESIDQIYKSGKPPEQPVLALLAAAIREYRLTKQWLNQLIASRESRLSDNPFSSINEAERYFDDTLSPALFLILQCLRVQSVDADHAASHLSRAQGLVLLVRGIPYFAQQRKVLLPMDLCVHHGLTQESIVRREVEQPLRDVVYDIAGQAHIHLEKAVNMRERLPKAALSAFLPAVPCRLYLDTLQRRNFNPFDPVCSRREANLAAKMAWKKFRGAY
eukprot:scpid5936/ scgid32529/ UPF0551 protein C8orf38 homolog, mitochondrial